MKCDRCSSRRTIGTYYITIYYPAKSSSPVESEALCRGCWEVPLRERQIIGHQIQDTHVIMCNESSCKSEAVDCKYIGGGYYYYCEAHSPLRAH